MIHISEFPLHRYTGQWYRKWYGKMSNNVPEKSLIVSLSQSQMVRIMSQDL